MSSRRERTAFVDPEPTNHRRADIEEYASKWARHLGWYAGWPMRDVLERRGGRVEFEDLHPGMGESGSLYVYGPKDFEVLLPLHTTPLRDQFTMAHELGHYILHSRLGELQIRATRQGSGRVEWEANWFAAGFLMPEEAFRQYADQVAWDTGLLAAHFSVSEPAAKVRAEVLRAA